MKEAGFRGTFAVIIINKGECLCSKIKSLSSDTAKEWAGLDWKTWTVIGLLLATAIGQVFVYFKRQRVKRRAADAGNIYSLHRGDGYVFFPASTSYYRSLYIDNRGIRVETERQAQELAWSQVNSVIKALNPGEKTLRNTYRLIFDVNGQDEPLVVHLGSFREEEIRSIIKQIKKRVRLVEQ